MIGGEDPVLLRISSSMCLLCNGDPPAGMLWDMPVCIISLCFTRPSRSEGSFGAISQRCKMGYVKEGYLSFIPYQQLEDAVPWVMFGKFHGVHYYCLAISSREFR